MSSAKSIPVPTIMYVGLYPSSIVGSLDYQQELAVNVLKAKAEFLKKPLDFLPEKYFTSAAFSNPYKNSERELEHGPGITRFPRITGTVENRKYPDFQNIPLVIDSGINYGTLDSSGDWLWAIINPGNYKQTNDLKGYLKLSEKIAGSVLEDVIDPFYISNLEKESKMYGRFTGKFFPSVSMAKRYAAKYKNLAAPSDEDRIGFGDILTGEPLSAEELVFLELSTGMKEKSIRTEVAKGQLKDLLEEKNIPLLNLKNYGKNSCLSSYTLASKIKPRNNKELNIVGLNYLPQWAQASTNPEYAYVGIRSAIDSLLDGYQTSGIGDLMYEFKVGDK